MENKISLNIFIIDNIIQVLLKKLYDEKLLNANNAINYHIPYVYNIKRARQIFFKILYPKNDSICDCILEDFLDFLQKCKSSEYNESLIEEFLKKEINKLIKDIKMREVCKLYAEGETHIIFNIYNDNYKLVEYIDSDGLLTLDFNLFKVFPKMVLETKWIEY